VIFEITRGCSLKKVFLPMESPIFPQASMLLSPGVPSQAFSHRRFLQFPVLKGHDFLTGTVPKRGPSSSRAFKSRSPPGLYPLFHSDRFASWVRVFEPNPCSALGSPPQPILGRVLYFPVHSVLWRPWNPRLFQVRGLSRPWLEGPILDSTSPGILESNVVPAAPLFLFPWRFCLKKGPGVPRFPNDSKGLFFSTRESVTRN